MHPIVCACYGQSFLPDPRVKIKHFARTQPARQNGANTGGKPDHAHAPEDLHGNRFTDAEPAWRCGGQGPQVSA